MHTGYTGVHLIFCKDNASRIQSQTYLHTATILKPSITSSEFCDMGKKFVFLR